MSLSPGVHLRAYEVIALLGAGGMGEVYRARDTKLNRDVAIKVLPDLFVSDAERLARFRREAQTLASLNHPNIGGIYGLEESSGITCARDGARRRRGPVAADRTRADPDRRGAADRQADRGSARSGARAGDYPSRSQAREHQSATRRHGEGAGLRTREGNGPRRRCAEDIRSRRPSPRRR